MGVGQAVPLTTKERVHPEKKGRERKEGKRFYVEVVVRRGVAAGETVMLVLMMMGLDGASGYGFYFVCVHLRISYTPIGFYRNHLFERM